MLAEGGQKLGLRLARLLTETEPLDERFVELASRQGRVADQHTFDAGPVDIRQDRLYQCRFAGSSIAKQQRQTARRRQAIPEVAHCFPLSRSEIEKAWIGYQIEGALAQPKKLLVHQQQARRLGRHRFGEWWGRLLDMSQRL